MNEIARADGNGVVNHRQLPVRLSAKSAWQHAASANGKGCDRPRVRAGMAIEQDANGRQIHSAPEQMRVVHAHFVDRKINAGGCRD